MFYVWLIICLLLTHMPSQNLWAQNEEFQTEEIEQQTPPDEETEDNASPEEVEASFDQNEASEPEVAQEESEPVEQQEEVAEAEPAPAETPSEAEGEGAAAPEKPKKIEEPEPEGIDTVDINEPEGNWLFKRIWWEKSKELFGKIRERVDHIVESRMHFFQERVKLDREVIDPFYVEVGLDQATLQASVNRLLDVLKAEREKDGMLDPEEVELYNTLLEEKQTLEQLSTAVGSIQQLDASLDNALNKLMEQINLARSYEREAWRLLNEIAEELSDKKAREHYYAISTIWRNVKEIANYIQGAFAQHFMQLASTSIQNVQSITDTIDRLQNKGIELKERIENKIESDASLDEDDNDDEPIKPQVGWFGWLWQKITGLFSW